MFGSPAPDVWQAATDVERSAGELTRDQCLLRIDGQVHHFIRGELAIPVGHPSMDSFAWSVWVTLSQAKADVTAEHWNDPKRVELPPMFGWLSNWLTPYDPPTINLAAQVITREPGTAPLILLDRRVDHPLVHEQVRGIDLHRVAELNRLVLGDR